MTVEWRADDRQAHLTNGRLSLILRVFEDGTLGQLHLGAPLPTGRSYRQLGPDPFEGFANRVGESIPLAYPTAGTGDFRVPSLVVRAPDGATALSLRYVRHATAAGKPALDGLPSTYVEADSEAETLTVTLADEVAGIEADLRFTVFRDHDAIARSATIRATGTAPVEVRTAMSASLDLPDADWVLIGLTGAWAREAHVAERPLIQGRQADLARAARPGRSTTRSSRSGARRPTSPTARPTGSASSTRATSSPRPRWTRSTPRGSGSASSPRPSPGPSPPASPSRRPRRSSRGAATVSAACPTRSTGSIASGSPAASGATGRGRSCINNWEGTYFDFDADRLVAIAASARELGVELFVLDDGWFGARNDDTTSLGDWFVDRTKLPDGLDGVAKRITALGLDFGLWIEPEMVSADSELFRAHPDWAIGIPGRPRTESRQQLVLDMGRAEVVDHLDRRPRPGPRERADLLHQMGHEPEHHRAVRAGARRPSARASSSTATSSACTSSTAA